jgi:hypothetical protein
MEMAIEKSIHGVSMLLSDAVIKFFPELARPNLTRQKSKSHWRGTRNKTRREKSANALAEKKRTIITKQLIHGKDDFPVLDISDNEIDVCITKEYDTLEIDINDEDFLAHDIEMVGNYREEDLIVLTGNLINRWMNLIK